MSLIDDLKNKTSSFFSEEFKISETIIVPSTDYSKLTFGNSALTSELTFLFIDIRKSSQLHDNYGHVNAAKIYQSFHDINVSIINMRNGQVRSFDGDRVMGVFSGDRKNNNAVEAALNIRWAISNILNQHLGTAGISIGIGIDCGDTLITKVGKGRDISNNDLVWVGKACNYASHMCNESENKIYISPTVYGRLAEKNLVAKGLNIWTKANMILKNGKTISCYQTNYWWSCLT